MIGNVRGGGGARQLDVTNKVNLLSYTSKNPYTTTKEGIVYCYVTYEANKYAMIVDNTTVSVLNPYVEVSTPSNSFSMGNNCTIVPAFVGMQLYAESNDSYGKCYFIPFK